MDFEYLFIYGRMRRIFFRMCVEQIGTRPQRNSILTRGGKRRQRAIAGCTNGNELGGVRFYRGDANKKPFPRQKGKGVIDYTSVISDR